MSKDRKLRGYIICLRCKGGFNCVRAWQVTTRVSVFKKTYKTQYGARMAFEEICDELINH